ncbi:MAG: type II toxin-antitoxin system RelE/ParE family toxin [Ruegeria sp.]
MHIEFANRKLKRQMESAKEMQKAFGERSRKLQMRLGVLKNAETLAEVPSTPPDRRHALSGKYAGCHAVDVSGNWRLVFEPIVARQSGSEEGKLNLADVTAVRIIGVVDYH